MTEEKKRYGADAIVDSLANHDVSTSLGCRGLRSTGSLNGWTTR